VFGNYGYVYSRAYIDLKTILVDVEEEEVRA
jgi:hypothetical protein